jgi:hypothetical protein
MYAYVCVYTCRRYLEVHAQSFVQSQWEFLQKVKTPLLHRNRCKSGSYIPIFPNL